MAELIIVFREVLEGSLIVGILFTYLKKTNQPDAIIRLWQGVAAALVASIIGSFLFQIFANGFEGKSAKLFEGIVMIIAAAIFISATQRWEARLMVAPVTVFTVAAAAAVSVAVTNISRYHTNTTYSPYYYHQGYYGMSYM